MSGRRIDWSRRTFLAGIGGVTLALPFLESLGQQARAANDGGPPRQAFFLRFGNGVQQEDRGEPERYWPMETGALTTSVLRDRDAERAVSELADFAPHLTMVKGTRFPFSGNMCGHSGGGNQVLTAARVSDTPSGNRSLAMGESIDNFIARAYPAVNGGEPLTLYCGPRRGYIEEVLSYRGPKDLRGAEDDPWNAYQRLVGVRDGKLDRLLEGRRKSVNDLVREQMQDLLGRNMSQRDRQRLELHFDSVREIELGSCQLREDEEQNLASMMGLGTRNDNRLIVSRLHMDVAALAMSCDMVRAVTLQVGDGNDSTQYTVDGIRQPSFHHISHRIYSDGSDGEPIANADVLHHKIDRIHHQLFAHMLTKLREAGVLESTVAVMTNDLGAGRSHTYRNIPWILAGSGDGFLKTGQFVDLGGEVPHSHLLSTIANAVGVRNADGSLVENFGDPSLSPGLINDIIS